MDIQPLHETKKLFTKPAGELIEQFFPFDKEKALNFQAGLVALKMAKPDVNAYAIRDEAALNAKLAESNITADAIAEGRKIIDAKDKSGALKDVPPLGDIAVKLGLVDVKIKDMLMEAQAAIRTLDAMDNLDKKTSVPPSLAEAVFDRRALDNPNKSSKDIARSFIGKNSPKSLTQIQAVQHLADIYNAAVQGMAWDKMDSAEDTKKSISAFKAIANNKIGELSQSFETEGRKEVSDKLRIIHDARAVDTSGLETSDYLRILDRSILPVMGVLDQDIRRNVVIGFKLEDSLIVKDLVNLRLNQARGVQLSGAEQAMFEGR